MPPRQPVPQPVTPVQTGSSLLLSGSQPASGTPVGAFSGPWCIEEQSLNMSYWRVPKFYFNSVTAVSLSSLTGTWDNANSTSLRYFVNASYRMSYSTEQFETSAWQQNQKFQVDPVSSDSYGTSYGSLTASSLGPAGNISTAVPYYSRRPWNNATDSTIYESVNGACNFALASSGQSYLWGSINQQEWGGRLFEFGYEFPFDLFDNDHPWFKRVRKEGYTFDVTPFKDRSMPSFRPRSLK